MPLVLASNSEEGDANRFTARWHEGLALGPKSTISLVSCSYTLRPRITVTAGLNRIRVAVGAGGVYNDVNVEPGEYSFSQLAKRVEFALASALPQAQGGKSWEVITVGRKLTIRLGQVRSTGGVLPSLTYNDTSSVTATAGHVAKTSIANDWDAGAIGPELANGTMKYSCVLPADPANFAFGTIVTADGAAVSGTASFVPWANTDFHGVEFDSAQGYRSILGGVAGAWVPGYTPGQVVHLEKSRTRVSIFLNGVDTTIGWDIDYGNRMFPTIQLYTATMSVGTILWTANVNVNSLNFSEVGREFEPSESHIDAIGGLGAFTRSKLRVNFTHGIAELCGFHAGVDIEFNAASVSSVTSTNDAIQIDSSPDMRIYATTLPLRGRVSSTGQTAPLLATVPKGARVGEDLVSYWRAPYRIPQHLPFTSPVILNELSFEVRTPGSDGTETLEILEGVTTLELEITEDVQGFGVI